MADHIESADPKGESLMEKITEKLHHSDSSSSDSDSDSKKKKPSSPPSSVKTKIFRLFGREKPVHKVFGGGKPADIFLWRNKKISAGVLGGATAIWVLFELLEYHLLTLVCHMLILSLAILFLWSNATTFINKTPPHIPEVHLPEEPFLQVASALRIEINRALVVLRDIASGKDIKMFLGFGCIALVSGLMWLLISRCIPDTNYLCRNCWLVGCVTFGKLLQFLDLVLHRVPVLYEKYEDQVDSFGEKAMIEIKKQYAVFDAKVLSKIPRGPLKDKKKA
ncbi:unnamed protein product [Camellia sinensis]